MDNKISLSFSGGYKVLNPVPLDPRCRPETMAFAATDPTYFVGFSPILDSATGITYRVAGTDVNGWVFAEFGGDKSFEFIQGISTDFWEVQHDLGKLPSVIVHDSSGNEVMGSVDYVDNNNLTITFSAPFKGTAILN